MNMTNRFQVLCAVCWVVATALPLLAENNTSLTINYATNTSGLTIGNGGTNNYLQIQSFGAVTNSGQGTIGLNAGGSNNSADVVGGFWTNSGQLQVGSKANNNRLTISSGGQVFGGTNGYIGTNGSYNSLVVTDSNSLFSVAGNWRVGYKNGAYNQMVVSNKAQASVSGAFSMGTLAGNYNSVLVSDGATLTAGSVSVGDETTATGNSLTLTNGGRLFSGVGTVGDTSSDTNTALVIGGGTTPSLWDLGNAMLLVGDGGNGNRLTIDGNSVVGGAIVSNVGVLYVGNNNGVGNSLIITNGGQLNTVGAAAYVGGNGSTPGLQKGATFTTVLVAGGGGAATSRWDSGGFHVGWYYSLSGQRADNNQLIVDGNGVTASAVVDGHGNDMYLGLNGGNNNSVVVTNGGFFTLGDFGIAGNASGQTGGTNNSLLIVGGPGVVSKMSLVGGRLILGGGNQVGATGCVATVDGAGVAGSAVLDLTAGADTTIAKLGQAWKSSLNVRNGGWLVGGKALAIYGGANNQINFGGRSAWPAPPAR